MFAENKEIRYELDQVTNAANQTFDETNQTSNEAVEHEKLLNQTVSKVFNLDWYEYMHFKNL